jgi:uncharacterized protein
VTQYPQVRRLARLARSVQSFDPAPRELPAGFPLPEKDAPILFAAMDARATHLITGDVRHFGPYFGKTIEGILILSPSGYLRKRRKRAG